MTNQEYKYLVKTPSGYEIYTDDINLVMSFLGKEHLKSPKPVKPEKKIKSVFPKPEPVGVYTSHRSGVKIPVFEQELSYLIQYPHSQNSVNKAKLDKVGKLLRKSGEFLTIKDIRETLKTKYDIKMTASQITNALIVLQILGKVRRYKKGRGSMYKTTVSHASKNFSHDGGEIAVLNKDQVKLMKREKEESRKESSRYAKNDW